MSMTAAQARAVQGVVLAIADAIKEFTQTERGGVPSGELYAVVCGMVPLQHYNTIIDLLVESGKVTNKNHFLVWVGD